MYCEYLGFVRHTYLAIPRSLVSHTGFTVDHNVSVGKLDIARRRGSHGPRVVRIGRGFEREVAQHHETGLAGLQIERNENGILLLVVNLVLIFI